MTETGIAAQSGRHEMTGEGPDTDTPSTQSEALANFALGLSPADIPLEMKALARTHMLDTLGIALASSTMNFGEAVLAASKCLGQGVEATAIGSGARLPATSAALVNGVLAHGLDYDDTHIAAIYHASAPALAAALAAGEANRASGEAMLCAYVAALEIGCRIASSAAGAFHDRGFHPTALCGTFAAAAAAARLNGDDHASLVNALGLCGSQAAGIMELKESWLKRLHPGWAAHSGLAATALGRAGFRGPATVLEGTHGFYATHVGLVPSPERLPAAQLPLGRPDGFWAIDGIGLKPYPCCHLLHAFVDAAFYLRPDVDLTRIDRIDCFLIQRMHSMLAEPRERRIRPKTIYDALFSVQYAVALALVKGRVDLPAFYDEPIDDPDVLALAARIYCHDDPLSDYPAHFPGEIRIRLTDGSELHRREATSRGTPERRLTEAEVQAKFRANVSRVMSEGQADAIIALVADIEALDDVGKLMAACTFGSQPR